MAKHRIATKRFAGVALGFGLVGFCFNLVGIFGPAWIVKTDNDQQWQFYEGIWLARYCQNTTCRVSTREHALQEIGSSQYVSVLKEQHWSQFKILTILAIACSLVAVVMTTIFLSKNRKNQTISTTLLMVSGITSLSSSMFLLIPVLKLSAIDSTDGFGDAWAKIMSAVGVFTHFAAAICMVFAVFQSLQRYCAIKQRDRSRSMRFEMVTRYLSSQNHTNTSAPAQQTAPHVISTSGGLRPLNSDSGMGEGTPPCSLPPYDVVAVLPSYSEISMR